jgi:hypothetical protein
MAVIREAVRAAVNERSTRRLAAEMRVSPAGLRYFLGGGAPYRHTAEKLRRWYVLHGPSGRANATAAGVLGLTALLELLPPAARPVACAHILRGLRRAWQEFGEVLPEGLEEAINAGRQRGSWRIRVERRGRTMCRHFGRPSLRMGIQKAVPAPVCFIEGSTKTENTPPAAWSGMAGCFSGPQRGLSECRRWDRNGDRLCGKVKHFRLNGPAGSPETSSIYNGLRHCCEFFC